MTARSLTLFDIRRAPVVAQTAGIAAASVIAIAVGREIQDPARFRLAVAGVASVGALALFTRSPRHLLYGLLVWLGALGLVRRLATLVAPASHTDPILLVLPLAAVLLLLAARDRGAFIRRGQLANSILVLQLLILLGTVNPLQGSVGGGFISLLFVLVPTLGFWIGRGLGDDRTMAALLRLVAVIAVLVGLYGLGQTFHGFFSWDQLWIDQTAFGSLNVEGVIRPFGTMSSAAEYGSFLSIGLVIWVAYLRRGPMLLFAIPAIALLATSAFLESSRGLVVGTVAALGVVVGARLRLSGIAAAIVAIVLLVGLGFVVRHVAVSKSNTNAGAALTAHQLSGLSNPLDPNASTLAAHWSLLLNGLKTAIHNPIGLGTGSITIAGQRFGGVAAGTELDPSNAAVAFGIPGVLAYLAVTIFGFRALYKRARRGGPLAVATLAVATVTVMQWMNGGQYAVALLPWLMLGWVDRPQVAADADE